MNIVSKAAFRVEWGGCDFVGQAQYILSESSFFYEPWRGGGFSFMIGKAYLGLDVDVESRRVLQVSGFAPKSGFVERKLIAPSAREGRLYVDETVLSEGVGCNLNTQWETYFNSASGLVCIGDCEAVGDAVMFAADTSAVVKNGALLAVWVKPTFV